MIQQLTNSRPSPRFVRRSTGRMIAAVVLAVLVAACSEQIRPLPPAADQPVSTDTRQAEALEAQGAPEQAARRWLTLAREAPSNEADYLLLRAADAWMMADEPARAVSILNALDADELTPRARAWFTLVSARLALRDGDVATTRALLDELPDRIPSGLDARLQQVEWRLEGEPDTATGRNLDSLPESDQALVSIDRTVRQVRRLDDVSLRRLQQAVRSSDRDHAAWAALTVALR